MKIVLAILALGGTAMLARADDVPPELKAIEARTRQADLGDEAIRARYIMDLARLRFDLIRQHSESWRWQAVDREIIRHPVPADTDPTALIRARLGVWHSSRHDYLFDTGGTWRMIDNAQTTTHGTWSIQGAQYSETFVGPDGASATTFTVILADADNFIFTDGTHLFFEAHKLGTGLPIRRDDQEP